MRIIIVIVMLFSAAISEAQTFTTDTVYIVGDMAERRVREFVIDEEKNITRVHPGGMEYTFTYLKGYKSEDGIERWRAVDESNDLRLTVYLKIGDGIRFEYYRGRGMSCSYE